MVSCVLFTDIYAFSCFIPKSPEFPGGIDIVYGISNKKNRSLLGVFSLVVMIFLKRPFLIFL